MIRALSCAALAILAGCHVRDRVTVTRPGDRRPVIHEDQPRSLPATVVVTADGFLRFVHPLRCPADVMVTIETGEQVTVSPNLATVVVGVVVTALGGVALARGGAEESPGSSGWTYAGGVGVLGGLALAIGPWIGNGTTEVSGPDAELRQGASEEPCGEVAVAGRRASVRIGRQRVIGAVDADGRFAVSPFTLVDVFAIGDVPALDITAELVDADGAPQTIEAVVEATALASSAGEWIAAAGIDARKESLRKIPRLEPGSARVTRQTIDGVPNLRIALPLANTGPGDAWQVRAVLAADVPEIDGRVAYVGHIAPGGYGEVSLAIPLSGDAASDLAGADLELEIFVRAADGTGPDSPVRFRGRVLADLPQHP